MNRMSLRFAFLLVLTFSLSGTSWAWFDKTHISIAKAAGYKHWLNAAGADMAKIKAGALEERNHYFNNYNNTNVTAAMVIDQAKRYNDPLDEEGHLYGAIISSLKEYRNSTLAGKYAEYHMAFAAHYIGDLSQPLHNVLYDNFNKTHHSINDGIVDNDVLDNNEIQKNMYEISIRPTHFEEVLASEIAKIANTARILGIKIRAENRDMSREEAYTQLGHSASLLKAVLTSLGQ